MDSASTATAYSVLTSVYAKECVSNLKVSIESMLRQTVPPSEIVLVKDGKLTAELDASIKEFEASYPSVIKVYGYDNNRGLWHALHFGLEKCSNNLVARMDTDDYSDPNRIERQLDYLQSHPECGCVGCNVIEFEGSIENAVSYVSLPADHDSIAAYANKRNPIRHPALLYKRDEVLRAGGYQNMPYFEDYDLVLRMIKTGTNFHNLQQPLVFMQVSDNFYHRRGSRDYYHHMKNFRKSCLSRGYISRIDYSTALIAHAIVCFMPNQVREGIYKCFLRKNI